MFNKLLCFALLLLTAPVFAQEVKDSTQTSAPTENTKPKQAREETLFRNAHLTGGFGGPIFSLGGPKGYNGFGSGGGGGLVFNHFFLGGFGMSEVFDGPREGNLRPAMAYGGLWMGYTFPTNKMVHLYTSVKIAGGAVGNANVRHDWDIEEDLEDVVFVAVPEAGLELNVARWFRIGGSVGYRYVSDFDGWGTLGKNDLNAPVYALTLRFGWF